MTSLMIALCESYSLATYECSPYATKVVLFFLVVVCLLFSQLIQSLDM
jgi:hypothetical protein